MDRVILSLPNPVGITNILCADKDCLYRDLAKRNVTSKRKPIKFVRNSMKLATKAVCLKLRLTFMEPCLDRADFLRDFPIDMVIPMRRTTEAPLYKKGFTDTVCDAWFIWWLDGNTNDNEARRCGIYV